MSALSLAEKVLRIEDAFVGSGIAHAFGGAIALAYYATPRATIDIDLNVFVPIARAEAVLALLGAIGVSPPSPGEGVRLARDEQARVFWDRTPLDLFFAYDALHESCLQRRQRLPFGEGAWIHVLSAEDLLLFKAIFDRDKDWRDIDELVFALGEELDRSYPRLWLERITGAEDARYHRLDRALAH